MGRGVLDIDVELNDAGSSIDAARDEPGAP